MIHHGGRATHLDTARRFVRRRGAKHAVAGQTRRRVVYIRLLKVNRWLNRGARENGAGVLVAVAVSQRQGENAVSYIDDFENAVATEAARRGAKRCCAATSTKRKFRDIKGVTYLNSGDWVESRTAISEDASGHLAIEYWCCAPKVVKKVKNRKTEKAENQTADRWRFCLNDDGI